MGFGTRVLLCGGNRERRAMRGHMHYVRARAIGLRARRDLARHSVCCASASASRNRRSPARILVFAVPSGMSLPFRDLASAQSPEPGHHDCALLLFGQGRERGAQPHDVAMQRDDVSGISSRRRRRDGDEIVGIDRNRSSDSQCVDGRVAGDRQQPGDDAPPPSVERVPVPPRAHHRFLRHVFRSPRLADDGEGESVDPPLEALDERGRSGGIGGGEAGEEGLVRRPEECGGHRWIPSVDVSLH